jgi:hypothetical protein
MRLIDYRPEAPDECPSCGGTLEYEERRGEVYIGPGDLAFAKSYGLDEEGPATTVWFAYRCLGCGEQGPVLIG